MNYHIDITPMGCVRMTRRGKYVNPAAKRYLSYKDSIQWQMKKQTKGHTLLTGALEVEILFHMPIPQSWSKKKQNEAIGTYHTKKPDSDNLVKSVFDSLNKIIWHDDNQVSRVIATKVYGKTPGIEIKVRRLGDE